jgi:meso-butanediol dehydrogenase / (S,S)-butanediol dehydrogenase / diacetyl reductase
MDAAPVAIITGAGSGIGQATAIRLAQDGFSLILVGRRRDALERTAESCQGPETLIIPADLSIRQEAEGIIDAAHAAAGRIDVIIHSAGHGLAVPVERTTPELFDQTMRINTYAPAWMALRAWPHFLRQRRGCFINIGSMAAIDPYPGFFAYGASKAALSLLTASLAKEGASRKIRAFCIAPGATETPMLRASFDTTAIPPDQVQDPQDVADVVASCIAGDLDALNGKTIPVLPRSAKPWLRDFTREHPSAWMHLRG